ncbi:energy-coupling factor transporter transmembrane component T [Streptococcus saliviloxodontae]|uniref:Cobalt/nickel transport system permease protein n=1 Tax=Streptococcus saliviloxodontae TaxID=1349416 RepID=A0ABS2PK29_9STRE|nr:energy-coupling factor transporter transmembrane component T [Streptococcus saliviloxodontae]MBM7635331.1 cobalt/nickel transport system permease protein [Streptococcus saliviloxodontae]
MILPDWLSEENDFLVKKGKDHFLIRNRRVLSLVTVKVRDKAAIPLKSHFHPLVWLLCLFFLLVGVSLSHHLLYFWLLALVLFGLIATLPDDSLRAVLKKWLLVLVFPIVLYLPSLFWQGVNFLFLIRLLTIALLITFYSELTRMSDLLLALKSLHFPDMILLQIDITAKYIYVFGNMLGDILKGIEARAVGQHLNFQIGSNIWGILYLKAVQYGKDLQKAMEARGFTGAYYDKGPTFIWKDYLCLLVVILFVVGMLV